MSLNKVMLIGNVGQEPTVRYLDTGVCVASVRLATTDRGYTMRDGTQVPERAEWHSLIFWDKLAETVEKYVHKGDKLFVEGKIQTRSYVDKQGITRQVIEIMVNNMEMLTPKAAATPAAQGVASSYPQQAATAPVNPVVSDTTEEEPPF